MEESPINQAKLVSITNTNMLTRNNPATSFQLENKNPDNSAKDLAATSCQIERNQIFMSAKEEGPDNTECPWPGRNPLIEETSSNTSYKSKNDLTSPILKPISEENKMRRTLEDGLETSQGKKAIYSELIPETSPTLIKRRATSLYGQIMNTAKKSCNKVSSDTLSTSPTLKKPRKSRKMKTKIEIE